MLDRNGYTMIELIFVMVIIGVLAAVSIPKLALTRNDASASVLATKLGNCIELAGKGYLESGTFDTNDTNCKYVAVTNGCFLLTPNDANGTLTIKNLSTSDNACENAQKIAIINKLSSVSGIIHSF